MRVIGVFVALFFMWASSVFSQDLPPVNDNPTSPEYAVKPPPDLRDWEPSKDMKFQLYVNFDGINDTIPKIDIMLENVSWPYYMDKLGDTVYLFIAPPGYSLKVQGRIDHLESEFPIVIMAGEKRRVHFWFSYENNKVFIDTSNAHDSFISVLAVRPLPDQTLTLQLKGRNVNAKVIRPLLKELGDQAKLVQIQEGFYENVWPRVIKTIVQNWKTNETQIGTFLVFSCSAEFRDAVSLILEKYRSTYASTQ